MQKIAVVLSMLLLFSLIINVFQFIKIQRLGQRLTYTINFISIRDSDLLKPMTKVGEISEDDMNIIREPLKTIVN